VVLPNIRGELIGVSDRIVREWLKPVKEEEKREKIKKALELREKGYTQEQIAKELGVSQQTISYWFKEFTKNGKTCQNLYIPLLTPQGTPTPEGLRLWSEYVEQSEVQNFP